MTDRLMCCEIGCKKPAVWLRATQFAGQHPFCDEHARKESDFQKETLQSTFVWEKLPEEDDTREDKEAFFKHKKEHPEPTPPEDLTPLQRRMQGEGEIEQQYGGGPTIEQGRAALAHAAKAPITPIAGFDASEIDKKVRDT